MRKTCSKSGLFLNHQNRPYLEKNTLPPSVLQVAVKDFATNVRIWIGQPLGEGATGVVHPAALEVQVKIDTKTRWSGDQISL